ncbi:phospholipase A2 inhibitor gamma subunit B-like [Erythrolamprus reginae]|uniref:phospholipase A2 inhibitor gamma subunit B-like n=1 Tax=Erythrolamprus reginae TaxID=121349 RepID=UPI00396CCF79
MSARFFVLYLLSCILSTAASLKCQGCFSSVEECRNEDMELVNCKPDENYCLSLSFWSTMMPLPLSFTFKSCATADQCSEGYYSFTTLVKKHLQRRIACCESDACNTAPLPIPGRDLLKPNGFVCPGSYEENGSSVESGPVLCLGDEDQCFNAKYTGTALSVYTSAIVVQGCTRKNGCAYPIGDTEQGHGLLRFTLEKMECQNPERLEGWNSFSKTFRWGWN